MQHQLQLLRFHDKVKQITYPQLDIFIPSNASEALIRLLEANDGIEASRQVKFYSRSIFISLALSQGDDNNVEDLLMSNVKSSLHYAYNICCSPEDFAAFMMNDKIIDIIPYYQSNHHQQIHQKIYQLIGSDFAITTPYDFIHPLKALVSSFNFESAVSCLIDFCLSISQTSQLSSQEIFVGCCLVLCQKMNDGSLFSLMLTYFQSSLGKGLQMKQVIKEQMAEVLSGQV